MFRIVKAYPPNKSHERFCGSKKNRNKNIKMNMSANKGSFQTERRKSSNHPLLLWVIAVGFRGMYCRVPKGGVFKGGG